MVTKKVCVSTKLYHGFYKFTCRACHYSVGPANVLTIPECTGFGQAEPSICQAGPSPVFTFTRLSPVTRP